ncbi:MULTISPECIES: DsbA family protein [unclassified Caballeronia]|uniref:DsbA family oxidoreductase n=1 Tax=unclassified Caballeronia TaxID=2646786 RepID=UPI001FD0D1F6|nr:MULTISPECIES: DsbA family oxidoreductase [unclassified Caballeronia]MDR5801749.1 DsbA family oxidoreductase [Caballeronia sp. LZ001]
MATTPVLYVDVWSDFTCPFCYLETPVLDQFAKAYGNAVELRWHAFELRPEPTPLPDPNSEQAQDAWENSVVPLAEERNMLMRPPPVAPRSRKAFETALFAQESGRFDIVHRAIFKAYFEEGIDIGDPDALIDIAATCGIDPELLEEALDEGTYTDLVIEDEEFAKQLGVSGVPFAVLSREAAPGKEPPPPIALRGAAPIQHFENAVERLFPDGFPS